MRSTASMCANSSIDTSSRVATRLSNSRTGPSMLFPASAARTWISMKMRSSSGRPSQTRASVASSAARLKPGCLPAVK